MAKDEQAPTTVVVDSNALFPKDQRNLVSATFESVWKRCVQLANLRLVVPAIVRGERLYQLTTFAHSALQSAASNLETVSKVSGNQSPSLPTFAQVKADIAARFDKWIKEHGGTI